MEDSSGLENEMRLIFIHHLTLLGNAAFSLAELAHIDFFLLQLPSFISGQTNQPDFRDLSTQLDKGVLNMKEDKFSAGSKA